MSETDNLLQWMATHSQITSRDQWADLLGYSKRTIDNWYSDRTIPPPALQHLRRIRSTAISDLPLPVTDHLRFTLAEWNRIDDTRRALGYPDTIEGRGRFFTDILTSYASTLPPVNPVNPAHTVRPLYSPEEIASSRLNEDPADPASPRKHTA